MSTCDLDEYYKDVEYLARQISRKVPHSVDVDDLISAGYLGLVDAGHKFDNSKDSSFRNYALYRIRGAMFDELRSHDPVPRLVRIEVKKLQKAKETFEAQYGTSPSAEQFSEFLHLPVHKVEKLLIWATIHTESLEFGSGCDSEFLSCSDAQELMVNAEMTQVLKDSLKKLSERDAKIVSAVFFGEMRLCEVAKVHKVTESRISQILSAAFKQMRRFQPLCEHHAV